VIHAKAGDKLLAYKRGSYLLAVNPGGKLRELPLEGAYETVYTLGSAIVEEDKLKVGAHSFVVLKPVK